ncbi:uncharacterized protein LOC121179477 [Toxotes jaculatrix]|uniref:uncharacterized protein LOC121179477 n=1 Tax=Toxotes jaculatrix TaxID=941984 RepID=UPI001B3AA99C|nr:uncharacterized protein LOC121179477 [Toxotes jaculatrix]XP_040890297.1 uncharacterized protein LOC121179477 [Toxotes jaculatrix]
MGSGLSQEEINRMSLGWYETSLRHPCLLPDVAIDESLWKYSGTNSTAELQAYSDDLSNRIPDYIEKLGSGFGAFTAIPNAVGLGALVISMIIELCMKSREAQTNDDPYTIFHRVFGEEKASAVRDTMLECMRRNNMFLNNDQRLKEELRRLEMQLSSHLTTLRNSLLYDGQMSSRGFKIWVNGASFHLQVLIHEARLKSRTDRDISDYAYSIRSVIDLYLTDLDYLLKKYKEYKPSTVKVFDRYSCHFDGCTPGTCYLSNTETKCEKVHPINHWTDICGNRAELIEAYMNLVFSKYEPVLSLKSHFSNIKNNLNTLIRQRNTFTLPSAI